MGVRKQISLLVALKLHSWKEKIQMLLESTQTYLKRLELRQRAAEHGERLQLPQRRNVIVTECERAQVVQLHQQRHAVDDLGVLNAPQAEMHETGERRREWQRGALW